MQTRNERGEPFSPVRLLEMLEFRFGAFEAIAYASLELARKEPDDVVPMDDRTADAILEFGDDLRKAYNAASAWQRQQNEEAGAKINARRSALRLPNE